MGVLDKLLDAVKINNDGYDDEDYLDDDYMDEEDLVDDEENFEESAPKQKKGFFDKFKKDHNEQDDYDEEIEEDEFVEEEEEPVVKETAVKKTRSTRLNNKITPYRKPSSRGVNMEVCVIKPTSMEDTREIADTLVNNSTVILNLEGIDVDLAQRIIDFTSGACYSLNGSLQKVSSFIFILGPQNVDITGDLQNILGGGLPTVRSDY